MEVQKKLAAVFTAHPGEIPQELAQYEVTFRDAVQLHLAKVHNIKVIPPEEYLKQVLQGNDMRQLTPAADVHVSKEIYYRVAEKKLDIPRLMVDGSLTDIPKTLTQLPFATIDGLVSVDKGGNIRHIDLIIKGALFAVAAPLESISKRTRVGKDFMGVSIHASFCKNLKEVELHAEGSVVLSHSHVCAISPNSTIGKDNQGRSLDATSCNNLTMLDVKIPGSINLIDSNVRTLGPNFSCRPNKEGISLECGGGTRDLLGQLRGEPPFDGIVAHCELPEGQIIGPIKFAPPPRALEF
jgi:hypothetical protein